jgi:uncharacterized membrane protein/uncharacterized protein YaaQ
MSSEPAKPDSSSHEHPSQTEAGTAQSFPEPVWTYRGYQLRASEFTTAMVHMFRAEVQRANVWRQRLDTTTNWAVVATGATLSFAFAQNATHIVIPLNIILVTLFLVIEARRYRYYELWSYRVRLMETDFFAAMLVPPFHPAPDWAEALSEHLLHPHFSVSLWEAIGRRLRRNYLWIYLVLALAWLGKLWLTPTAALSLADVILRARVGEIPGQIIWTISLVFYLGLIILSIATIGLQESSGEVLPRYGQMFETGGHPPSRARAWYRHSQRRKQLLVLIVTDQARAITERVLKDMNRGMTTLAGTGGYTGQSHSVLLCAVTLTEISTLKALVSKEDHSAFVIVTPAQEIFGRGFMPLEET